MRNLNADVDVLFALAGINNIENEFMVAMVLVIVCFGGCGMSDRMDKKIRQGEMLQTVWKIVRMSGETGSIHRRTTTSMVML